MYSLAYYHIAENFLVPDENIGLNLNNLPHVLNRVPESPSLPTHIVKGCRN